MLFGLHSISLPQFSFRYDTAVSTAAFKFTKIHRGHAFIPGVFATWCKPAARRWVFEIRGYPRNGSQLNIPQTLFRYNN
jgi:hypothetical protein